MVTAGGNIISNAAINLAGAFTATANGAASTIAINAPLNTGAGAINLTAAGGITATGGMTTAGLLTTSGGTTLSGTNNLGSLSAATSLSVAGGQRQSAGRSRHPR